MYLNTTRAGSKPLQPIETSRATALPDEETRWVRCRTATMPPSPYAVFAPRSAWSVIAPLRRATTAPRADH